MNTAAQQYISVVRDPASLDHVLWDYTEQQRADHAEQQRADHAEQQRADQKQIKKLKRKNKKLNKIITLQGEQIERNRAVTESLLTGLFDPNLQACAYGRHLTTLNGKPPHWYDDAKWRFEEWGSRFPTTVQGDKNEKRINVLAEQVEGLAENVEELLVERDEKLTRIEERLTQLEEQIAIMEKKQLDRLGLTDE